MNIFKSSLIAILLLCAGTAIAVPSLINYQGYLTNPAGTSLDTVISMTFTLYSAPSGGVQLWTETQPSCTVRVGLFNVQLGSVNPMFDNFDYSQVWIGIAAGNNSEMTPRQRMVSVPYAYRVGTVDGSTGGTISRKVNIGLRNSNDGNFAFVTGENDTASGDHSVVSGGEVNRASGSFSFVGGGYANQADGYYSVVGGGTSSVADDSFSVVVGGLNNHTQGRYSLIGGGKGNSTSADWSAVTSGLNNSSAGKAAIVSGGTSNSAAGDYSVVGGGFDNSANDYTATVAGGFRNAADSLYSVVGGGAYNLAHARYCTISGGAYNYAFGNSATVGGGGNDSAMAEGATVSGGGVNSAKGNFSVVSGGLYNHADDVDATVGGGAENYAHGSASTVSGGCYGTASGWSSTVGGGAHNKASGDYSVIAGGGGPNVQDSNSVTGDYTTIGGGSRNFVWGNFGTVSGGYNNDSCAYAATIPGGHSNSATGQYSFAAGHRAKANHNGAFVWADQTNADFGSSAINQFNIRASGGVRFATTTTGTVGVKLDNGDTAWEVLSDSTKKSNRHKVNTKAILDKVAQLPIEEWNYTHQDAGNTHIGPMAQTFHKIFGYGDDEKSISTIDPDGIALAAIQELAKENLKLQTSNSKLEERISQLEKQLQLLVEVKSSSALQTALIK